MSKLAESPLDEKLIIGKDPYQLEKLPEITRMEFNTKWMEEGRKKEYTNPKCARTGKECNRL